MNQKERERTRSAGYYIKENVISKSECDRLIEILSLDNVRRSRAGARNLMKIEAVSELAFNKRLLAITKLAYGKELVPYKATLFEKSEKANWLVAWHQDTALPLETDVVDIGWGPSSDKQGVNFVHAPTWALSKILALRIHLDASTSSNGPLRVIPGSHSKRLLTDAEVDLSRKGKQEIECLVGKGGVIAMSPLILHASSKAVTDEPRRVLHIEYATSLELAPGGTLAIA
jgi:ectoine hydroxylase-related dioxygenase (phytanoyl-CoA dioxygenase family)